MFCRRFTKGNKAGNYTAAGCFDQKGSLEHILVSCPYPEAVRERMYTMYLEKTVMFPSLHKLIQEVLTSSEEVIEQFFIEPLALPMVRQDCMVFGQQYIITVSHITRTFVINREYQKRLNIELGLQ